MLNIDYGARPNSRIMAMTAADRRKIGEEKIRKLENRRRLKIEEEEKRLKLERSKKESNPKERIRKPKSTKPNIMTDVVYYDKPIDRRREKKVFFTKDGHFSDVEFSKYYNITMGIVKKYTINVKHLVIDGLVVDIARIKTNVYILENIDGRRIEGALCDIEKESRMSKENIYQLAKSKRRNKKGWTATKKEITWED